MTDRAEFCIFGLYICVEVLYVLDQFDRAIGTIIRRRGTKGKSLDAPLIALMIE